MRDEPRAPLDDAIDEVAQSLSAAPPSPALRASIRRRIETRPPDSFRLRSHAAVLTTAGLATSAVVVVLFWPSGIRRIDSDSAPAIVREAPRNERSSVPPVTGVTEGRVTAPRRASETAVRASIPTERTLVVPDTPSESAIEPIVTEPLVLEPLLPDVFALDSLPAPMPLVLDELNIEPLEMP